jgi:hypothetical protein
VLPMSLHPSGECQIAACETTAGYCERVTITEQGAWRTT